MSIQNVRGRGMSDQAPPFRQKPYRYRGIPGWNPAASLPARVLAGNPTREGKIARVALFTRLRESGKSIAEAAEEVGVGLDTGREYERLRLAGGAA